MSCSRRGFLTGMGAGALIMMTGPVHSLAASMMVNGKRLGMLHDETACIGCTACMDACREVNKVPNGVSRLQIVRKGPIGTFPEARYHFYRHSCQHCDNAPCVHVCPTGASHVDAATGIVDVNADLCVGCQYCIAACPYRVRFINPQTRVADKCDFCLHTNLARGKLPACVEACPTQALTFGDLDDPHSAINQKLATQPTYRAKSHLGTSPKMYRVAASGSGEELEIGRDGVPAGYVNGTLNGEVKS
ncbi:respiratory nitrite reductase specific menaquinol--cytochrome-c reductase complex Fe-S cluster containing subunit NrfC [Aeromonas sp. RU39B]|uniref:4Fe-4S dicluster domain-containing protein n=1 Tax=Aeromonas sp. RU39B TaxID=1907416 RepID=UPI0009569F32|nr:4Fe-4S dicluster domain-containing protein [Aeromonas sp. RU39B]SIQ13339.1 respiratory nitrite reductase specific menaquinol--cytochrome-c reductase complex Fe-S cluster containing subunit NrfC [Aeromonas sp. RU39B]